MGCLLGERLSDAALKRLAQANTEMLRVDELIMRRVDNLPTQEKLC